MNPSSSDPEREPSPPSPPPREPDHNNTRLLALADASFDAVVLHEDGIVVDANPRFGELFGCRVEDIVGRAPILSFVAPESVEAIRGHFENDEDALYEAVLQRADGSRFVAEIQARTIHYGGRRTRIAITRDISQRKQAEARSRLYLELVSDLSQASTQIDVARIIVNKAMRGVGGHLGTVGIIDPDGQTISLLQATGLSETMSKDFGQVPLQFPGPLSDAARTGEAVWIETQDEYVQRYPNLTYAVQQQTRSHATACLPLRIQDQIVGAIGISFAEPRRFEQNDRDFLLALAHQAAQALDRARLLEAERSARARAEAAADRLGRLQSVMSALSQALTAQQVADVIVNEGIAALEAHAGSVAVLDEAQQLNILYSIGYRQSVVAPWRQVPLSADVPIAVCVRENAALWLCSREDLNARFPQLNHYAAVNAHAWAALPLVVDGQPIGAMGLSFPSARTFDADERALLEALAGHCAQAIERARLYEAEARARAEAEKANALKVRFLGMISHELRTPLTSIKGFASTLLATDVVFDAPTQRQYISIIDTEANKLTALVEQLLDVSRLQAGTLPIRPEPHRLTDILDVADVQMTTLTQEHTLDIKVGKRLPVVMADPQRIAQVIVNLVDNAAKYSPPGQPIRLRAKASNGFVEVRVSDSGLGIPRKDREFIFEAFQQLERKSGARRGAGLGLAICKGLVEAHGGRIWVQETRGRGTTIAFTLPVVGKSGETS